MAEQKLAIVTDATVDLMPAEAETLGIEVGPVTYVIDGTPFPITLDMDAEDFIARVDRKTQRASSAGVNAEDFTRCYERALARAPEVLCITIPRKISSTWTFAVTAADLFDPGQVEVFDTHQVHLGETALVAEAAEAAQRGLGRAEVVEALGASVVHSATYIAGRTFGVLEDIGRLKGKEEGMQGQYNLQRVGDDEFRAYATAAGWQEAAERVLEGIDKDTPAGAPLRVYVASAGADANTAARAVEQAVLARRPGSKVGQLGVRPSLAFFGGGTGSFAVGFCPRLSI